MRLTSTGDPGLPRGDCIQNNDKAACNGRLLYAASMPVIHRADSPPRSRWNREEKIAVLGVVVGLVTFAIGLAVDSGTPVAANTVTQELNDHSRTNVNVNNPACQQFCGGQTFQDEIPKPVATTQPNKGCAAEPGSKPMSAGWGPPRNLLGRDQLSEFPSFNLDNFPQIIGDERHMYSVREDIKPNSWMFDINAEPGKTYVLRMYIHNSAGDHMPELTAQGTRVMVSLPTCTGYRIASNGFLNSTNALPSRIFGGVTFNSDKLFNLAYVKGSAMICTNHYVCNEDGSGGAAISEDFLTSNGALVGYDALDGQVRGGYQYSIYFIFKVRSQFAQD